MRLNGLTVLVTGAGSGIGRATALVAAREGGRVVCVDVAAADKTASEIRDEDLLAEDWTLDVRDGPGWSELVSSITGEFGGIDVLANVAGIAGSSDSAVDQSEEGWRRVIDVNLMGPWLGMRAVIPGMIERGGGRIVNVSSLAALVGVPGTFAYAAAKGGMISMSRQAAMDYASKNVLINVVAPGMIETPLLGDVTEELRAYCRGATPLGRVGRPEDIAGMIVHLAGPDGGFITGHVFPVDGGWSAQ
jgi:NAD(P)-dependent dehydrogenase (short-subunit alcohol dehydrogenase family)